MLHTEHKKNYNCLKLKSKHKENNSLAKCNLGPDKRCVKRTFFLVICFKKTMLKMLIKPWYLKLNLYIFSQKLTAKVLKTIYSIVYLKDSRMKRCENNNNILICVAYIHLMNAREDNTRNVVTTTTKMRTRVHTKIV